MLRWIFILFVISASESGMRLLGFTNGSMRLALVAFISAVGLIALSFLIKIRANNSFRKGDQLQSTTSTNVA